MKRRSALWTPRPLIPLSKIFGLRTMNRQAIRPLSAFAKIPTSRRLVARFSLAFRDCPPVCGSSRKKVIRYRSASVADFHGIPSRRTEGFGLIKNNSGKPKSLKIKIKANLTITFSDAQNCGKSKECRTDGNEPIAVARIICRRIIFCPVNIKALGSAEINTSRSIFHRLNLPDR